MSRPDGRRESWRPGDHAWFEYHCFESDASLDAVVWHHSQQVVTVLREAEHDGGWGSLDERAEAGTPKVYRVRFADGLEYDAFEDELLTDSRYFSRPAPPPTPA